MIPLDEKNDCTLSNKTVAIFGSFILYATYKVRAWELHLALVK